MSLSARIHAWRRSESCSSDVSCSHLRRFRTPHKRSIPGCKDETVVYDFSAGATSGSVHWKADKIVDGKRLPMGELDLVYSRTDSCWRAESSTQRFHVVWCVTVDGPALTGSATLLPGKQVVRKIQAHQD
jgi:hypothetical protein